MQLNIRVIPRASKNEIIRQKDGSLKVRTTCAPIDGKANKAILKLLSEYLHVPKNKLSIAQGLRNKNKIIQFLE